MNTTRLIIFDLDGTLLNTLDDLAVSTNHALHRHGYPEHDLSAYRYFVGNGITRLIERALPAEERQEEKIRLLREEFVTYYQRHKTDLTRPYPGIPQLLEQLHRRGILLSVASNKYQTGTEELIHHYFGTSLFSVVLGQRENVPVKPDPAIILDILLRTQTAPADTLYIGDSGVDMQTARNAGITSIGVTWGFRSRQELTENGACYLADRPEDILQYL